MLGLLVKDARERRGYQNQSALARELGRDQSFVSRLERGVLKELPPPEVLRQLGDVIGLSMEDMLTAAGYLEKPERNDPPETITIPATDPRARILAVLDGLPDHAVNQWVVAIEALTATTSQNAERGIPLPNTRKQPKTA